MVSSVTKGGLETLFRGFRGRRPRRSITMEISDGLSWFFNRQWGLDRVKLNDFGRKRNYLSTTYGEHLTNWTKLRQFQLEIFDLENEKNVPFLPHIYTL